MKSILRRKTFIAGALVTGIAGYSFLGYSRIQAKPLSFEIPLRSREEQLKLLKSQQFDVLVIGGGATGTGIALDAQTRGLSTALVEARDFSSGTSSKSTKLVHGGVRYLEKAFWSLDYNQFSLVLEALGERAHLLNVAPHLTYQLPIMLPVYHWWLVPYYYVGSKAYDFLAGGKRLSGSYFLGKKKTLREFPMIKTDSLKGAIVYYDGAQDDARMNVMLALTAAKAGACMNNYVEVVDLIKDQGRVVGVRAKNVVNGEVFDVKAKVVVSAAGPWTDELRKLDEPSSEPIVVASSGVHVVLPDYYSPRDKGLLDPQSSDGRVVFVLPWNGKTIAGTTDSVCEVSRDQVPRETEINFILGEVGRYLGVKVRRSDVLAAWSGIRPLVRDPNATDSKSIARTHVIFTSPSGLVVVAGGKWTTYRRMAEDAVDAAIASSGLRGSSCITKSIQVHGAEDYSPTTYITLAQKTGFNTDVAKNLASSYGTAAFEVAAIAAATSGAKLHKDYPYLEAEVRYAVRSEYACTASDVLGRRVRLAFVDAKAAQAVLPRVVEIMGEELHWNDERKTREIAQASEYLLSMGLESKEQ